MVILMTVRHWLKCVICRGFDRVSRDGSDVIQCSCDRAIALITPTFLRKVIQIAQSMLARACVVVLQCDAHPDDGRDETLDGASHASPQIRRLCGLGKIRLETQQIHEAGGETPRGK